MITLTIAADSPDELRKALIDLIAGTTPVSAETARAVATEIKTRRKPVPQADAPVEEERPSTQATATDEVADSATSASLSEGAGDDDVESTELDYQRDIKPGVLKVSQKLGRSGVEQLLSGFDAIGEDGNINAANIKPHNYPELMAAITTLLEG